MQDPRNSQINADMDLRTYFLLALYLTQAKSQLDKWTSAQRYVNKTEIEAKLVDKGLHRRGLDDITM